MLFIRRLGHTVQALAFPPHLELHGPYITWVAGMLRPRSVNKNQAAAVWFGGLAPFFIKSGLVLR